MRQNEKHVKMNYNYKLFEQNNQKILIIGPYNIILFILRSIFYPLECKTRFGFDFLSLPSMYWCLIWASSSSESLHTSDWDTLRGDVCSRSSVP